MEIVEISPLPPVCQECEELDCWECDNACMRWKFSNDDGIKTDIQTCDNCKYTDDCPEDYKAQQPNYCENWEQGREG